MKLNVPLPFDHLEPAGEFTSMAAVRAVGAALERAGFHAGLVTDHPCLTGRWLDSGGHHAQGPFVMLSLLAAVTATLRLQTGLLVLPYRNPFVVARDVATLDRFSGGRVALSFGAGYLKGEFRALGADFDRRNETTDEYMRALRVSLTGEEFTFQGTGYEAFGNRILPGPVQARVPLYIGGNSRRAIRRVVEIGDGWNPFFTVAGVDTGTTRTAAITGAEELAAGITYMAEQCSTVGRADMPEIVLAGVNRPGERLSGQELIDRIGAYAELGVTAAGVTIEGRDCAEWCDNAERIGSAITAAVSEPA